MATGMKELGSRRCSNVLPASCRKTYARPNPELVLTITKIQMEPPARQPIPAYSGECPLPCVPRSVLRKITKRTHFAPSNYPATIMTYAQSVQNRGQKRTHFNTADSLRASSNPSAINLGRAGFTLDLLRTGISGHSCPIVPNRARSWSK